MKFFIIKSLLYKDYFYFFRDPTISNFSTEFPNDLHIPSPSSPTISTTFNFSSLMYSHQVSIIAYF